MEWYSQTCHRQATSLKNSRQRVTLSYGESNRFPYSIGRSLAENPKQTTFNPFFIHGASGVGKTHLVNAIGLALKERFPKRRVLYVTAHQFMVQFTESRRMNTFNSFINFYQTIDTLIIDDIQELSGQEKTQEAFFHVFNHLKMNGKQIILTSDRAPATMPSVRLKTVSLRTNPFLNTSRK